MKKLITCIACTSLLAGLASAQPAQPSSEEFSRKGRWEVYGFGQAAEIFNVLESDADVLGGGLGVGYHPWEHFSLRCDLGVSSAKFKFEPLFSGSEKTEWTTLYMGNISLDYHILKTPLTPLITVGAGVGWFSEGVGTTFDQNIGVGVRWDASEHVFARAVVSGGVWENTNQEHKGWAALGISLAVGYRF